MTPIEKNMVRVTDVDKNVLAPTYMRRARGLVKAGRAEWTSPEMDEICLFRPPAAFNMEDKMHNNPDTTDVSEKATGENTELTREEFVKMTKIMLKTYHRRIRSSIFSLGSRKFMTKPRIFMRRLIHSGISRST